ncbi:NUDIX hydrolase [Dermacoccaceae bacterium W4C1]
MSSTQPHHDQTPQGAAGEGAFTAPIPDAFAALRSDALTVVADFVPGDALMRDYRSRILQHLQVEPGSTWRHGHPRHLTAGVMLFDEAGEQVLLTLHRKAGLWLHLGGHLEEGDASVRGAAYREAIEESGLSRTDIALSTDPVEVHTHVLNARFGSCREHLDVRYAGIARSGANPVISEESADLAWWPVQSLPATTAPDVGALIAAGLRALPGIRRTWTA